MKLDIEGKEFDALHNASLLFKEIEIPYVFMEWGVINRDYKAKKYGVEVPKFIVSFFQERGYSCYSGIDEKGKLGSDFSNWPWDIIWQKKS